MIVFLNGSFGVGKTTVANRLVSQLPNSVLFDPEEVGGMLMRILRPIAWTGDFQDYQLWRRLVPQVAEGLVKEYGQNLVIPMTLWRSDYFDEVIAGLQQVDSDFHHFCLQAPREVVVERIERRGHQGPGDWVFEQLDCCIPALQSTKFQTHIQTEMQTPDEVVSTILHHLDPSQR